MDGFDSELFYPSLTKEEKETLLAKKIEDIRRKNKELERRHAEIEADKKLAVGSRSSVQLPAATAATVRRAPANDGGDEGDAVGAASSAALGAADDARRVERMPSQSGDARRELQGTATTAVAHGRSGRTPARRGRGPSTKGKINGSGGGGGGARCSSRDSSLLKFPLKKPGLGFRRFSRESLAANRRRPWPPKKGAGRASEPKSSASGADQAAVRDRSADRGLLAARADGPPSWRAQHRRGGSGDVTTVAAAAAAAAQNGGVTDGVNGAVVTVAGDGNSTPGRSGSGSALSEAIGGAAGGLATGSRECDTKSGGCSVRARGSTGRSQRKNYEETRKRNSAVYEYEHSSQQQQQQQQRRRSGTGIADGATHRSPPPTQPTRLDLEMRLTGRERRAYSAWKEERDRVDEERVGRARDAAGGWRREWDADKAEPPTPPPPSSASTGSASIAAAAAAPQWPAPASSATSLGPAPTRSVLSAAAPAWPYTQSAPTENGSLFPQPPQQQRQQRQRRQRESPPPAEASFGWMAESKSLAQPPPSGCQRKAVGSGRFMSQGDRRKSGPGSGSSDVPCSATAAPRDDIDDLKTRRQPAWPDSERRPSARRAPPPPPRSPAGTRGGRGGRGGSVGGTRGRRWPSRGGWRMQRSAYGGSASSLHRPSSRTSIVEDIVIIHVEDDDGEAWPADSAGELGNHPAVKTEGAGAVASAATALSAGRELSRETRASASTTAGLSANGDTRAVSGTVATMATSAAAPDARSGRAGENRKRYPDERYSNGGRRRRGGGGRGRMQVAASTAASRDDARSAAARPRVDGRAGQNKDDEWEDVADAESGTR